MNLVALEALRAFVEGGSISEAAERVHRSPSQVSRLLASLEDEAGFPLLIKDGRRLALTEEGQGLYQRIDEMLRANDAVTEYTRNARRKSRTHVNVLVAQHLIEGLLVDAIARAVDEAPNFSVTINARMQPNVDAWISQQQFDLALAQLPVEHPLLTTEVLAETQAVAILGQGDPRCKYAVLTPQILGEGRFIGLPQRGALSHRYAQSFAKAGFHPSAQIDASFGFIACQLAVRGCGAALTDPLSALTQIHRGAQIRRFEPAITLQYGLIYPKARPPSTAALLLIRHLRNIVAERLGEAETLLEERKAAELPPRPR